MNRVSSRRRDAGTPLVSSRSKCLIQTEPVGNAQLFVALKPKSRLVLGTENHRVLIALSDQNGTFRSYSTIPAFGVSGCVELVSALRSVNAPVAASVGGNGVPVTLLVL